jgi:hypothetical protein
MSDLRRVNLGEMSADMRERLQQVQALAAAAMVVVVAAAVCAGAADRKEGNREAGS